MPLLCHGVGHHAPLFALKGFFNLLLGDAQGQVISIGELGHVRSEADVAVGQGTSRHFDSRELFPFHLNGSPSFAGLVRMVS